MRLEGEGLTSYVKELEICLNITVMCQGSLS